jgi:hypothetical protein
MSFSADATIRIEDRTPIHLVMTERATSSGICGSLLARVEPLRWFHDSDLAIPEALSFPRVPGRACICAHNKWSQLCATDFCHLHLST